MLLALYKYWKDGSKEKQFFKKLLLFLIFTNTIFSTAQNNSSTTSATDLTINVEETALQENEKRADSLLLLSSTFLKERKFENAFETAHEGLQIFTTIKKTIRIGDSYRKIALIYYYQAKYPQALQNYDNSIVEYKKVDAKAGHAAAINNKGAIFYYLGNYPKALDCYKKAVELDGNLNNTANTAVTIQNIGGIYAEIGDYTNALKYLEVAKKTFDSMPNEEKRLTLVLNSIGEVYTKKRDYRTAIDYYDQALNLAIKIDDDEGILETYFKYGEVYYGLKKFEKALLYFKKSLRLSTESKNQVFTVQSLIAIGNIRYEFGQHRLAISFCSRGLLLAQELKIIALEKEGCNCLYNAYKGSHNLRSALTYYEKSIELKDSLNAKETTNSILNMEFDKQILKDSIAQVEKDRKIELAHIKTVEEKERQRNILIISGCFILVFSGGLWSRLRYTKKSKAVLQLEKDRSEHLLLNILPEEIAEELKQKGYVDAQDFETATILFTDFKSFTETAALLSPKELVEEINVCFKAFDGIMSIYNIEKIKTIGDAYMAAGGLPKPDTMAVKNTILAALEMQEFIIERKQQNTWQGKPAFDMRVGIHVGPIVAGIVGVKKFQYDVWGDTVNIASRMESNGDVGKVNISEATYDLVKDQQDLDFRFRGKINAKGKGELSMYFVSNKCS